MRKLSLVRESLVPLTESDTRLAQGGDDANQGLLKQNSGSPSCIYTYCFELRCIGYSESCPPRQ